MLYLMALGLGLTFGVPVAVLGAGLGQGRAAAAALEGMARQPAEAGTLRTAMILSLVFIETLVIFSLLVFFLIYGKLPETSAVMDAIKAGH